MSYFRPPAISPWTIWMGRAVALGGVALGLAAYTQGVGFPGISEGLQAIGNSAGIGEAAMTASQAFTPLLLGTLGSLAVWRSTEKADQVRRLNRQYHRGLNEALDGGLSDIHLPSGLLDKQRQASWLATTASMAMGALLAVAGVFLVYSGMFSSLSTYLPSGLPSVLGGLGLGLVGAGYTAWQVGSVAAEAREFAHSGEASAERGRIAEAEAAQGARMEKVMAGLDPAPAVPARMAPVATPLTDSFRAEQAQRAMEAEAALAAAQPRGFLARLMGERSQPQVLQR